MREALIKKRFGVPALFLIAILLTAGSIAAILVANHKFTATTTEPLTFEVTDNLNISHPGESDGITVEVTNAASVGYGIFVNNTVEGKQVKSVSYSTENLFVSEPDGVVDFNGDGDLVDAEYNIGPNVTSENPLKIIVTIDTAHHGKPGEITVTLAFNRESKYEQ